MEVALIIYLVSALVAIHFVAYNQFEIRVMIQQNPSEEIRNVPFIFYAIGIVIIPGINTVVAIAHIKDLQKNI